MYIALANTLLQLVEWFVRPLFSPCTTRQPALQLSYFYTLAMQSKRKKRGEEMAASFIFSTCQKQSLHFCVCLRCTVVVFFGSCFGMNGPSASIYDFLYARATFFRMHQNKNCEKGKMRSFHNIYGPGRLMPVVSTAGKLCPENGSLTAWPEAGEDHRTYPVRGAGHQQGPKPWSRLWLGSMGGVSFNRPLCYHRLFRPMCPMSFFETITPVRKVMAYNSASCVYMFL